MKYADIDILNAPEYIRDDCLRENKWKEYTDMMNNKYMGDEKSKVAFNWVPRWIQYFCLKRERKNKNNGKVQTLNNIYPNTITPYCELVFWQKKLCIQDNMKQSLRMYQLSGLCSVIQGHGLIQTHIREFTKP